MAERVEFDRFEVADRGFHGFEFTDQYGCKCSIQKSSLAFEDCIWFGVNDANPQILASQAIRLGLKPIEGGEKDNGWVPYVVPDAVLMHTRMHLTRKQVKALIPILRHFAKTGNLPDLTDAKPAPETLEDRE